MNDKIKTAATDVCPLFKEYGSCERCDEEIDIDDEPCIYQIMAKLFLEKGYRKASEVAREIFEEIEKVSCRVSESNQNGEWVQGDLSQHKNGKRFIKCGSAICSYEVIPETVGQYTGLTDKNGKKIFEGDIVNEYDMPDEISNTGIVKWSNMFMGWHISQTRSMYCHECMYYEVIGNIHDNPELSESEDTE